MIKRPMKGVAIDEAIFDKLEYPVMGFSKIDGFRCILGEYPLTSRLSVFPNVHFHNRFSAIVGNLDPLDGEAVVGARRGPGVLSRTSSGLTSKKGKPDATLWVFDRPKLDLPFEQRYLDARKMIRDLGDPRVRLLRARMIDHPDDLRLYLETRLALEYEGIIVRSPKGPYKFGKSTLREGFMLKCKPFDTAEGKVVDWFEEMENTNEAKREKTGKLKRSSAKSGKKGKSTLGGFILHDIKDGTEVRVGGGFTKPQRKKLWELIRSGYDFRGTLVRYKKQKVGQKDKPRHPNFVEFVDFRPEWDMTD